MAGHWFRFYDGVVDDPKVQLLPPILFRLWVNLLCLASGNRGRLPSLVDMSFSLRIAEKQLSDMIGRLVKTGLVDQDGGCLEPHNWNGRQFKADVSTERVQKFRERHKKQDETVSRNAPDTEQRQSRTETDISSLRSDMPAKRKTRHSLPNPFPLETDRSWAQTLWLKHGRADLCSVMDVEAEKFRDHHSARLTTSADWSASWRTWAQNAIKFNNGAHNGRAKQSAHDIFIAAAFEVGNGTAKAGN